MIVDVVTNPDDEDAADPADGGGGSSMRYQAAWNGGHGLDAQPRISAVESATANRAIDGTRAATFRMTIR